MNVRFGFKDRAHGAKIAWMKKLFYVLIAALVLVLSFLDLGPAPSTANSRDEIMEGTVLEIEESSTVATVYGKEHYQKLIVKLTRGGMEGETITVENGTGASVFAQVYEEGDRLVLMRSKNLQEENIFSIVDRVRRPTLYALFALFVVVVLLVSRKKGLLSLLGMALSFFILFKLVLPMILLGYSPLWTVIAGSAIMIPTLFYLSHGIEHKTTVASLGTFLTLVFTGLLASIFVNVGRLTGLADEAATFLKSDTGGLIDFKGLLLGGILVSLLGILDDISISQASIVEELRDVKKNLSFSETFERAMKVGKDHIASLVNTLVLVYAGAALPLLLLFLDHSHNFTEILNYEYIAEEIIQTLIASIGLILTVPVTTLLACVWVKK